MELSIATAASESAADASPEAPRASGIAGLPPFDPIQLNLAPSQSQTIQAPRQCPSAGEPLRASAGSTLGNALRGLRAQSRRPARVGARRQPQQLGDRRVPALPPRPRARRRCSAAPTCSTTSCISCLHAGANIPRPGSDGCAARQLAYHLSRCSQRVNLRQRGSTGDGDLLISAVA